MDFARYCPSPLLMMTLVCVVGCARLLGLQSSPSLTLNSGTYRIAGTVISSTGGTPLARARVTIADAKNLQRRQWMITGDDGHFEFDQAGAGKYSLQGAKKGFIRAAYEEHEQYSTAIVTGAGVDTEHLIFRLSPSAVLAGRVLDESGEPVRRANVIAYREDRRAGISRILRFDAQLTDDRGSFEIAPLDPGTYFLSASAAPWYAVHPLASRTAGTENMAIMVDRSLDVAYPLTFYADVTDSDEATPIPVRGGDRIQVDIHLNPSPALHLLFRAPESSGEGGRGINMPQLQKRAFDSADWVQTGGTTQMVSPGLFEITGVAPGRYFVRSQNSAGQPSPDSGEVDLNTNGQELEASSNGALANLKASVQITGMPKIPDRLMIALLNSRHLGVAAQPVDAQGQVEFNDLVPGQYSIVAGSPGKEYSIVQMTSQGDTPPRHVVNVEPGASLNLRLTLVTGEATVEGFAKRDGKPVAGAMIVLVPKNPESNRDLFRRDQSDLDGSFSLRSVIPGAYTVVAIEDGWDLDWSEPGVIAHYCQRGRPIQVTDRAEGVVRLNAAVEAQAK